MLFKREPAIIIGAVQAAIACAVAFGLSLSAEQTGAVLAVTAALLAVVTRQSVYAPATVEHIEAAAAADTTTPADYADDDTPEGLHGGA